MNRRRCLKACPSQSRMAPDIGHLIFAMPLIVDRMVNIMVRMVFMVVIIGSSARNWW